MQRFLIYKTPQLKTMFTPSPLVISIFKKLIVFLFLITCCFCDVRAQGDLFVNPKRLIFEGTTRSQEINLANTGKDTARYIVSFLQIRMKEDGTFEQIKQADSGQYFADPYLRIYPRMVTLAPLEAQVLKIQLKASDLKPGEYRSHLYFRAVKTQNPLTTRAVKTGGKGLSVELNAVFGITIPIIIRSGQSTSKVNLSDLRMAASASDFVLQARFIRSGNMSVYGDLTVKHVSNDGKMTTAGILNGVAVYTPTMSRDIKIKLDSKAGINYSTGKLIMTYSSQGGTEILAQAELVLK